MPKYTPHRCPVCGEVAKGTYEKVPGVCTLDLDENGVGDYDGQGTEFFWDGAETQTDDDGRVILLCSDGHDWPAVMTEDEE